MASTIQIRRDTAANWTFANPILASGEAGYETDTKKLKIGDGVTHWSALAYFYSALQGEPGPPGDPGWPGISGGSGSPSALAGTAGNYYFRTDTPSTANQRIYVCTSTGGAGSAVWVGII